MNINYNNLTEEQLEELVEYVDWSKVHSHFITPYIKEQYGSFIGLQARIWFKDLLSKMEIKVDKEKYSGSIFFFIDDELVIEQDSKNDFLWVSSNKIWSVLESNFGVKDTQSFIKNMVEEHFILKVSKPICTNDLVFWQKYFYENKKD